MNSELQSMTENELLEVAWDILSRRNPLNPASICSQDQLELELIEAEFKRREKVAFESNQKLFNSDTLPEWPG